jgi:two-component system cell cycle sensor histidine kinase/response regulator CckA
MERHDTGAHVPASSARIEPDFAFINAGESEQKSSREPDDTEDLRAALIVLVVEDNELMLRTLRDALRASGIGVLAARRGERALELFSKHHQVIDALIVDECIPGSSGRDIIRAARRAKQHIKAVLTSGYFGDDYGPPQMDSPDSVFLYKPFSIPKLIEMLRAWKNLQPLQEPR